MANDYDKLKKQLIEYYQDLLIVQYHDKPKAKAMIKAEMEETLANLLEIQVRDAFDVDTAVGVQLDIIGKWVGVDRIFKGQMFDNKSWFSLTRYNEPTNPLQGGFSRFDNFDTLEGGFLTYDFIVSTRNQINDTDFRMLIKLKIIRNNIKHSPKDIDEAMYKLFADTLYTVWNEMVYNPDAFTVVGSPTITDNGVYSATQLPSTNYIKVFDSLPVGKNIKVEYEGIFGHITDGKSSGNTGICMFREHSATSTPRFGHFSDVTTKLGSQNCIWYNSQKEIPRHASGYYSTVEGDKYKVVFTFNETRVNFELFVNGVSKMTDYQNISDLEITSLDFYIGSPNFVARQHTTTVDLKSISITIDGKEVFTGAKEKFYAIGD